jgi:hypothetical protein
MVGRVIGRHSSVTRTLLQVDHARVRAGLSRGTSPIVSGVPNGGTEWRYSDILCIAHNWKERPLAWISGNNFMRLWINEQKSFRNRMTIHQLSSCCYIIECQLHRCRYIIELKCILCKRADIYSNGKVSAVSYRYIFEWKWINSAPADI